MSIRDDESMPETHPGHLAGHATESGSFTSKGSNFVKSIGGKARSLLNTLDRNFGPSINERDDEVSSMTIEFLYSRLQAQRTVYKAEKQRVQQLVKKVMELEQKLKLETARRKEAECRDSLISPRCRSFTLRTKDFPRCNERACIMSKSLKEKGIIVGSHRLKDDSHYAVEHEGQHTGCRVRIPDIENEAGGGGAHHRDGHMAQFYLCHRCECHRSNCQELSLQHCSPLDKQLNASCTKNPMLSQNRENMDWGMESAQHLKEKKANIMLEMEKMNLNTKNIYHELDSWNKICSIDTIDYQEAGQKKYASLVSEATPGVSRRFLSGDSPRKVRSFRQRTRNNSIESLEFFSLDNLKSLFTGGMSRKFLQDRSARARNNLRDPDDRDPESIMNSPTMKNFGASSSLSISSPFAQQYKKTQEDRVVERHICKQEVEGRHAVASMPVCSYGKGLFCNGQRVH